MNEIWRAATMLRQELDSTQYKDNILSLLFYKKLSENMEKIACEMIDDGDVKKFADVWKDEMVKKTIIREALNRLGYYIEPVELYESLHKKAFLSELESSDIHAAFKKLEKTTLANEISGMFFKDIFVFHDISKAHLAQLFNAFSDIQMNSDTIGQVYMQLKTWFGTESGNAKGEYYTPECLCRLVSQLLSSDYKCIRSISDPACGSGSLLLNVVRNIPTDFLHGRDSSLMAYKMMRMNIIMNEMNFRNVSVKCGDTLKCEEKEIFQVQVANPPFSLKWMPEKLEKYKISVPGNRADCAFVQDIIYHMGETAMIILPLGVLYRQGVDKQMRKLMLKENLVDTVIELPQGLFQGTATPVCILILKKIRETDDILFINTENLCTKQRGSVVIEKTHRDAITEIYRDRCSRDGISKVINRYLIIDDNLHIMIEKSRKELKCSIQEELDKLVELSKKIYIMQTFIAEEWKKIENSKDL